MRPDDFLHEKHFLKLMLASVLISLSIATLVFYITQQAIIAAAIAATLIVSDYVALKILTKDKK